MHVPSAEFRDLQEILRTAARLDEEWRQKVAQTKEEQPRFLPWMPFPISAFTALLAEAYPELPGDRFLEIGCGPGSKMLIAEEQFFLDAYGFDRVPEYVAAAEQAGLQVEVADAATWEHYGEFDVIWMNRPFRDPVPEYQLELKVWADMAPGAVLMCANLEYPPPSSWPVILDDWEARRGIWMKPALP